VRVAEIELAASGDEVTAITLDSNVVISAGEHREYRFRIEQDFILSIDGSDLGVHFDAYVNRPTAPRHMNELAALVRCRIGLATAGTNGVLRLTFEGEPVRSITVRPHALYEAWTYTHGNYILACPPGGEMNPMPDTTP
jgi:hypothetical protein